MNNTNVRIVVVFTAFFFLEESSDSYVLKAWSIAGRLKTYCKRIRKTRFSQMHLIFAATYLVQNQKGSGRKFVFALYFFYNFKMNFEILNVHPLLIW